MVIMPMTVTSVFRYPVKSCRGESLRTAVVEPWGLAGDRRWMIVDADGAHVTAREHPRLVLITPSIDNSNKAMHFTAPGLPELRVPVPSPHSAERIEVTVWGTPVLATLADDQAAEWFTKITEKPVRLVYLDDPTRRAPNPDYSLPGDRVSLADGYPLLLVSAQSLERLNDWIFEGPHAAEGPLPVTRFRPSVVIAGAPAFAEDGWKRVRIGDVAFRVAKGCDRCVLTTIDPQTAVKGREPLVTLARHRRWDGKIWFGVNLIPDLVPGTPGVPGAPAVIRPGDPVELLA
jgi:uncharacterized protein